MPTLLEDLTQQSSANNRLVADRLEAEVHSLDEQRTTTTLEQNRQQAIDSARAATEYVITGKAEADGLWNTVLDFLHKERTGPRAERLLQSAQEMFESRLRCVRLARDLWKIAEELGTTAERREELRQLEQHFVNLAVRARKAVEHRTIGWQPKDPARLAEAMTRSQGKTVSVEEVLSWFPKPQR